MWFKKNKMKVRHIAFESKIQKYKFLIKKFENSASTTSCWLYFFDSTRDEIQQLCLATDTLYHHLNQNELLKEGINLIDARELDLTKIHGFDDVLLIENHPLQSFNQQLIEGAKEIEMKELIIYSSLDEPVMSIFGGDRIKNLLAQMGIRPDEPIEHTMISKSIEKAQERIEEKLAVHHDVRSSPEEWSASNPIKA
jgi:hypothetical protein